MDHHGHSSWAQTDAQNVMGLEMQDEDLSEFLNFNEFSNYDSLDNGHTTGPQPFGSGLGLPSSLDDDISLRYFDPQPEPVADARDLHAIKQSPLRQDHGGMLRASQYHSVDRLNETLRASLPTPNSSEIYGKTAQDFYQHHQEQLARHPPNHATLQSVPGTNIDMSTFTPFESPSLDGSQSAVSCVPEYAIPGSYGLSPLSSPAINPQKPQGQPPCPPLPSAETSAVESPKSERAPADPDDVGSQGGRPRKTRKRTAPVTRSVTSYGRKSKQVTSNGNHKDPLSLRIPKQGRVDAEDAKPRSRKAPRERQGFLANNSVHQESMRSSNSPNPANEALMAPPPIPRSQAAVSSEQGGQREIHKEIPNPATPTSMMRAKPIPLSNGMKSDSKSGSSDGLGSPTPSTLESNMEYLRLPEAASSSNTSSSNNLSRDETGNFVIQPRASPASHEATSESPRPVTAHVSPAGPTGVSKPEQKPGRGTKKRNSNSSNLVSPALRPKVSPGIKALLPDGGGMDSQTQALILASRSNYQNIITGQHVPGVSYDSELRDTLTSKRTSHKLAEQGRRNRINDALKEMQTMLPPTFATSTKDGEDESGGSSSQHKSKGGGSATQGGNSKAATVENAIEYIRHLESEMRKKDGVIQKLSDEQKTS